MNKALYLLIFCSFFILISSEILSFQSENPDNGQFEVNKNISANSQVIGQTTVSTQTSASNEKTQTKNITTYHTVIIGAGMAGMTAANEIAKTGKSVLVLEANNYMGGRMKTSQVPLFNGQTFNFQYGANWIHGTSNDNPIVQLANQISGANLIPTDAEQSINVYQQNGKTANDQVDKEYQDYQNLLQKVNSMENISMYQAFQTLDSSKLSNKYFMYNMANDVEFETSGTLDDLSAQFGQDDSSFQGVDKIVVSGYQRFVQHLSNHNNIKILLNRKVNQVSFSETTNLNTIICQNGQSFIAQNVIFAIPLGVLKKNTIRFSPILPEWKISSIESLHMGNVCKILLIFKNEIKVQDKQQFIGVVANDVNQRGAATYFVNLNSIANISALMTFGLGPNANSLQFMSENQLKDLLTQRIRVFLDKSITSNDFDIIRSNWRSDSNFGGAYTYSSVQAKRIHWENMAKPIFSSKWYFCGEHTYSKYRGTVHGAYLSGKAAAQSINNNVSESNWRYAGKSDD